MPLCQNQTLAETRQQGLLRQFGNNAKRSRSSGPDVNSQSHGAVFVAVHHQELVCKETDSALNSGLQSKKDKRYFLNETRDKKGHRRKAGREGGREGGRERERWREHKGDRKRTW